MAELTSTTIYGNLKTLGNSLNKGDVIVEGGFQSVGLLAVRGPAGVVTATGTSGNFTVPGNLTVTTLQPSYINVGRGNVIIETNIKDASGTGAGFTLRASTSPPAGNIDLDSTNKMFAIRTADDNLRFAVGTSETGTGLNNFRTVAIFAASATLTGTLSANSLIETSSIILKENIRPLGSVLSKVCLLNGVIYDRKDGSSKDEVGLIAEEVDEVFPSVVSKNEEGNSSGVQYSRLTAYLIEAIKELRQEVNDLRKEKNG